MIRTITRPSTVRCTLPMYIGFLLSEPNGVSCSRLASVLSISHDSVNRFLNREAYAPKDLYREVEPTINPCPMHYCALSPLMGRWLIHSSDFGQAVNTNRGEAMDHLHHQALPSI